MSTDPANVATFAALGDPLAGELEQLRQQFGQLRQLLQVYEAALQHAELGVFHARIEPPAARFTSRAASLLGVPTLVQRPLDDVLVARLHPDDRPRFLAAWRSLVDGHAQTLSETVRLEAGGDGVERWRELNAHAMQRAADGRAAVVVGLIGNADARREQEQKRHKLERQLLHIQKSESLGALAGGIAHDFNNILMSVAGNLDLARGQLGDEHPAAESIDDALQGCAHASDLCSQLLAYAGLGRYVVQPLDLKELVTKSGNLLLMTTAGRGRLRFELSKAPVVVEADAGQLRQVLLNLVLNAAEALTDPGQEIVVRVGTQYFGPSELGDLHPLGGAMAGSYAVLEVRDQGAGMDARTRARIFEPFFSTKGTGRGLGLSAVSGVVRGHGGAIKLRSTPGQGTSFLVLLPQSTREAQAIPTYRSSRIASKGRGKVLVVDDQPEVLKVTGKMLERAGFEALKASGGQEAIALAEQYGSELRVALVDLIMPGLGGEQVLAELKRLQPNLPVILITGFHERALHEGYRQRGFAGLLAKPFQIEDLSRVLQEALLRIDEV